MAVRLVLCDIDGTLLDPSGCIPPVNVTAVQRAAARGVRFVLASGRMTACIAPFFSQLGIDGMIMAYNGSLVRAERERDRRIIYDRPLCGDVVDELITFSRRERVLLNLYFDDRLYADDDPLYAPYWQLYAGRTKATYHFTDLAQYRGRASSKAVLITEPDERERLYEHFAGRMAGRATLIRTDPEYLEFTAPGVTKGSGLTSLAAHLDVGTDCIAAIGDGDNDVEMIAGAGHGVAVRNATARVLEVARHTTTVTAGEGAVAEALGLLSLC